MSRLAKRGGSLRTSEANMQKPQMKTTSSSARSRGLGGENVYKVEQDACGVQRRIHELHARSVPRRASLVFLSVSSASPRKIV